MPTFLNKIIVGKNNGSIELWNVSVGKLVYAILPSDVETKPVTALEPCPVLGLLAIAHADGSIFIRDVEKDKVLLKFNTSSSQKKRVTSISFRSDGLGAGEDGHADGIMATASADDGDVTLWDLTEGGRIMGVLRNAHYPIPVNDNKLNGGITKVQFLAAQPVLITSGSDNSLKTWIFDENIQTPIPRILHSRSGHAGSVTRLHFLPAESDGADAIGKWLLSSGRDRSLWGWSLRRDGQSTELSQGNIQRRAKKSGFSLGNDLDAQSSGSLEDLKAPEITCLACSLNRDGGMGTSTGGGSVWTNIRNSKTKQGDSNTPPSGWESIVTGHKGDKHARTWFWGRKKAGRWAFETRDGTEVKSVAVTPCGTFALVGSAGGGIDMFNLQSGQHRQQFPSSLSPAQARKLKLQQISTQNYGVSNGSSSQNFGPGEGRHIREVTGISVDNLNKTIFSCGLDGKVKFWDFTTGLLRHELDWAPMVAIIGLRMHRQSDLIALSCDDLSIRVIDTETYKLVRELWGCVGQVTDFCFSNDGRWIVSASLDSMIRVWDLPTGHLIDAIRVEGLCTALAFSPTGEFLATAHADSIGVNIWSNRSLFTHISTRHISEAEIFKIKLPTASGEGGEPLLAAAFDDSEAEDEQSLAGPPSAMDQLNANMTTLSLVPRSRWQTLLHLDVIAARNKPLEPPKAPEKAPFFLPSVGGPQIETGTNGESQDLAITPAERSRIMALQRHGGTSLFTQLLHQSTYAHEPFIRYLKSLSPAAADIEIRSLKATSLHNEFALFVEAMCARLQRRQDYEVVQAWMSVYLRAHGEILGQYIEVIDALSVWQKLQDAESKRLGSVVGYCSGVVAFLRSAR